MRQLQRQPLLRLATAVTLSLGLLFLFWLAGTMVMLIALMGLLVLVVFALLTVAPDAIALWRKHPWRWWWRQSENDGPFWPGTRIPKHP